MAKVFLLFGGNLNNPAKKIAEAIVMVEQSIGPLHQKSALYESEPWGFEHENNFINQLAIFNSQLSPHEILKIILNIEQKMGRSRNSKHYEARIIDIDILFYDQVIIKTNDLEIPHPRIQERRFVLEPLMEIAADYIHPVLNKTIPDLIDECEDSLMVSRLN